MKISNEKYDASGITMVISFEAENEEDASLLNAFEQLVRNGRKKELQHELDNWL